MNCTETCPKGLNPARAISNTKRMMASAGEIRGRIGTKQPLEIDDDQCDYGTPHRL
jgi:hypothetical protein